MEGWRYLKISLPCSICFFGPAEQPMIIGLKMAVVSLLLILLFLMALFVRFFLSFRQRAKMHS